MRRGIVRKRPVVTRPRRWRSWRALAVSVVSAVLGLGLAGAAWHGAPLLLRAAKEHQYFRVSAVDLSGNVRLTRADILQAAGISEGMSIWDALPHATRLRIEQNAWIERASVRRSFPNRISVRVRERRPLAIARLDGLYYVDRHGRVLGPLRDDDSRDFVIITGLAGDNADGFTAVGLHRAARLLRMCERVSCFESLSEVRVERRRGITVYPVRPPVAVTLGWGGWRHKLVRSARVFALWGGQAERLENVDVSFRDQVVVRLRAEERPAPARPARRGVRI
ncbi:FtsQ-type POTRA domain-containing protein [Candidatus Binatia bacterium]|nr:FtsQ-type POTRA domain-containing protein [Candidatus Binatia bacterium]